MIQRSRLYVEAVKRHDALLERKKAPPTTTGILLILNKIGTIFCLESPFSSQKSIFFVSCQNFKFFKILFVA